MNDMTIDWIADAITALEQTSAQPRRRTSRKTVHDSPVRAEIDASSEPITGDHKPLADHAYCVAGSPIREANLYAPTTAGIVAPPEPAPGNQHPCATLSGDVSGSPVRQTRLSASHATKSETSAEPSRAGDHNPFADQAVAVASVSLDRLVEDHRRRWDMIRARQRLELQAQAVCRRQLDGDKVAAAKLWQAVKADPAHELRSWLDPYLIAMQPLEAAQLAVEKGLKREVKKLPVAAWAAEVKGLGEISLAGILGECADPLHTYKSVAAVWKRMGLAVIGDQRQRRIAGDEAIIHGYNAQRRSLMWNVGLGLIKAQVRKDADDPEKRVAIGPYGALYLERKAYEAERVATKAHAHNRAQRYVEKRLLRDLCRAWRDSLRLNQEIEAERP